MYHISSKKASVAELAIFSKSFVDWLIMPEKETMQEEFSRQHTCSNMAGIDGLKECIKLAQLEVSARHIIEETFHLVFSHMTNHNPSEKVLKIAIDLQSNNSFLLTAVPYSSNFSEQCFEYPVVSQYYRRFFADAQLCPCQVWDTVIKLCPEYGLSGEEIPAVPGSCHCDSQYLFTLKF